MRKTLVIFVAMLSCAVMPLGPIAAASTGSLIKGSGPAVYYVTDGKRYVFPNEKTYFSWYADFKSVAPVSDADLASFPIGGNVTYKPGTRLVKLQSAPDVYTIDPGGTLRWLTSEDAARALFGADWHTQIDDLPEAFFLNYRLGGPVASVSDVPRHDINAIGDIATDLAARTTTAPAATLAMNVAPPTPTLPVSSSGNVSAVQLGVWTDPKTWGGQVPQAGAHVVIPAGVKVIFDAPSTPDLASIDLQGTLEFSKVITSPMSLSAKTITVSGLLSAGTSDLPITSSDTVHINLTASGQGDGETGILVRGGTLALYGLAPTMAWTTLASPAAKGATTLKLMSAADWPVGSEIVITSTSRDTQETEIRHVIAVSDKTLTLDAPLSFRHWADDFTKAEVGMLTRTVTVHGNGSGHVAVTDGGSLRLSGIALSGLGQNGVSGMSAVRLDGLGASSGPFIRSSVIRESARCLDISRTDKTIFEDNVALDILGTCVSTATGAEVGTQIQGNLIASVHAWSHAAGDDPPAGILLRNPDNRVEGNAIAGSEGHGYWYMLSDSATRIDGTSLKPDQTTLGSFNDNAVRGAAKSGLFVDNGAGTAEYTPAQTAIFSGLHAVESGDQGFWARGSNLAVSDSFLGENRIGGGFSAFGATFQHSTVVGDPTSASSTLPTMRGFVFQDGPVLVDDVHFIRFMSKSSHDYAAFGFNEDGSTLMDPLNGYRSVTFRDATPWSVGTSADFTTALASVRNLDAKKSIVTRAPFLGTGCTASAGNTASCDATFAQLQVAFRDATSARDVSFDRLDGQGSVTFTSGPAFDGGYAYLTVAEGGGYRLRAPFTSHVSFHYAGTQQAVTMRLATGANVQVKTSAASKWSYDKSSGDLTVVIAPGDDADVSW